MWNKRSPTAPGYDAFIEAPLSLDISTVDFESEPCRIRTCDPLIKRYFQGLSLHFPIPALNLPITRFEDRKQNDDFPIHGRIHHDDYYTKTIHSSFPLTHPFFFAMM